MSCVYQGNYAQHFEMGRVEFLRTRGISYKDIEAEGVRMPVVEINIKYKPPAKYDDLLRKNVSRRQERKVPKRKTGGFSGCWELTLIIHLYLGVSGTFPGYPVLKFRYILYEGKIELFESI